VEGWQGDIIKNGIEHKFTKPKGTREDDVEEKSEVKGNEASGAAKHQAANRIM